MMSKRQAKRIAQRAVLQATNMDPGSQTIFARIRQARDTELLSEQQHRTVPDAGDDQVTPTIKIKSFDLDAQEVRWDVSGDPVERRAP
jgi:hypothetical protein